MSLTAEQIFFITVVVVPLLAQGLKLLAARFQVNLGRFWVSVIAFVISVGLSYLWLKPALPVTQDPMTMATEMLVIVGSIFGFATLIYNLILNKLFEKAGAVKERFLK